MKNNINKNLYKLTLKKLLIPAIMAGAICLVISVTNTFSSSSSLEYIGRYYLPISINGSKLYNGHPIAAAIAPALILLMYFGSAVFTFISFRHLNNRSASDFYDSLGYSRVSGYISRLLAVFTWQYGIILMTMLARIIIMSANGVSFDWSFVPKLLLSYMAGSALIIGCVSLAMSITGNIISNIVASLAIFGLPRFLLFVSDRFIVGTAPEIFVDISKFGIFLNPVYNIPTAIVLDVTRKWEFFGVSEILINPGAILYTFILGIIYLGAGLLLMKNRKSELAGKGAPSKALGHILSAAVALPFLAYGFYSIINYGVFSFVNYDEIQICITFIAIGFLSFIALEFVMLRNIKSLIKSIPIFIVTLILSLGMIYTQNKIGLKINSIVPDADEIEYIKFDENYATIFKYKPLYTYRNLLTKDIEFTDPELISLMQDNFKKTIENNNEIRINGRRNNFSLGELYCEFKLKNGKSIYRNISIFEENKEAIGDIVTTNPEYLELSSLIPPLSEVTNVTLFGNGIMPENFSRFIYESFLNEYENADLETKNNIALDPYSNYLFRFDFMPYPESYHQRLNFTHLYVDGQKDNYGFKNYYYINEYVPNTAKLYFTEINKQVSERFYKDIEEVKENTDDSFRYWLTIEVIYTGDLVNTQNQEFYMIYNINENNPGGYLTNENFDKIMNMIGKEDLEDLSLSLPIIKITLDKEASDYSLRDNYQIYAQLSEKELQFLYDIYYDKLE